MNAYKFQYLDLSRPEHLRDLTVTKSICAETFDAAYEKLKKLVPKSEVTLGQIGLYDVELT